MMSGPNNQQTARASEAYVVAELNRRGAFAAGFAGNLPGINVVASNVKQTRKVFIQIKSKRSTLWQTPMISGKKRRKKQDERNFWIFVNLQNEHPEFYVCPKWWVENNIYEARSSFLESARGSRKVSPKSAYHSISINRVKQWKDRWDVLGVL
jgi:hypothetical protein